MIQIENYLLSFQKIEKSPRNGKNLCVKLVELKIGERKKTMGKQIDDEECKAQGTTGKL